MPKTVTPLSSTGIKNFKPTDKVQKFGDGRGLFLKIKPSGSKSWIFEYAKPFTKKRTSMSFGLYPSVSLSDARCRRDDAKSLLTRNIDPKLHRDAAAKSEGVAHGNTFEVIAKRWFEVKIAEITADYANDIWRSLERNIFEDIGKIPIHLLTAQDIILPLKKVESRGALETVKRLTQRINEIMYYAVNVGIIKNNPASAINKTFKKPKKQHLPTIKPEELPVFLQRLSMASITLQTRCVILWQLHTMCRPSEAAGTRWSEIDIDNMIWTIPPERMKKDRVHIVPLSVQAINILKRMKEFTGHREFVFPSIKDPRKPMNNQTANTAIKRMGFHKILVAHGLRALASTTLNEHGFNYDVIEAALAHVEKNEVRKAYNRAEYLVQRRELINWWSNHIDRNTSLQFL
jgi:integrase